MIIPAVIPTSRHDLDHTLEIYAAFASEVQVDIVDGLFASPASWPYTCIDPESALQLIDFRAATIELDLMIDAPEDTLDMWLTIHPARMVVHVESVRSLEKVLAHAGSHTYQLGLAFNNETDIAVLQTLPRNAFDYVQLMGIADIGKQGQPFDERVLARISTVRTWFPDLPIQIDGGVNSKTIVRLRQAGATRFVSGSAILKAHNPQAAYAELAALSSGKV